MGSFRILLIIFFLIIVSCDTVSNEIEINSDLIGRVKKDSDCLNILQKHYGIDSKRLEKYKYFESLLSKYIAINKDKKYTRFLFLRLEVVGEVIESFTFSIGESQNGKLEVIKYFAEDNEIKTQKKVLKNQTISNLYNFFEKDSSQYSVGKTLILDFTSTNSKCSFYNNLSLQDVEKIKELTFFKP